MSKLIFTILTTLATSSLFGQGVSIQEIQTAKDVENLIRSLDENYADFEVFQIDENGYKNIPDHGSWNTDRNHECQTLSKILEIEKAFFISDFDKNGYDDLLVYGYGRYTKDLLYVMNSKDGLHSINRLYTGDKTSGCIYPKKINDSLISLTYYSYEPSMFFSEEEWIKKGFIGNVPSERRLLIKNLVFKYGGFIELNQNPKKHKIESINYKTTYPSSELTLNQNKVFRGSLGIYPKQNIDIQLRDSDYNQIIGLLNYIDFDSIEQWHDRITSHMSSAKTEILFDDNQLKIIFGDINTSNFGLQRFYALMEKISEQKN